MSSDSFDWEAKVMLGDEKEESGYFNGIQLKWGRSNMGYWAAAMFVIVYFLFTATQFFAFRMGAKLGLVHMDAAYISVLLNAAAVAFTSFILILNVMAPRKRWPEWVLNMTLHATMLFYLAIWLFHIHLAGTQNTLIVMLILATAVVALLLLGRQYAWLYLALGTFGLIVLVILEYLGVLEYAPLLARGGEIRSLFLDKSYTGMNIFLYLVVSGLFMAILHYLDILRNKKTQELARSNYDLRKALDEVRRLKGLIPICPFCKKVRKDEGYWEDVGKYIETETDAKTSAAICPECMKENFPDIAGEVLKKH